MYDIGKCILVTNNDKAADKFRGQMKEVLLLDSYGDVLKKVRDLIHTGHKLLTHPQASSLKPNQTPYRSVILYEKADGDNTEDVLLIEKALSWHEEWSARKKTPVYSEEIENDYKLIDLSMMENVIPHL